MLKSLSRFHQRYIQQVKQVKSFLSLKHYPFSTSLNNPQSQSTLNSSIQFSGISESVISKCSHYWNKKIETSNKASFKEFLVCLSNFSPKIVRRFWGISDLKPENVLEILLGFDSDIGTLEFELRKVESLWGFFKWASEQCRDFKHLPRSCNVMASMLIRVGLVRDVEVLLSTMENEGIVLDNHEIFSNLVESYVGACELERAVLTHDRMRGLRVVPSLSCYHSLLDYLVQMSETMLVIRVYDDMLCLGLGVGSEQKLLYENVIQLLCRVGKVQEARNFVKKVLLLGMGPTNLVLDAVADGYCEKKDYDDLLSFFDEVKSPPDVLLGNKIIFSFCRDFGAKEAFLFMQELGQFGHFPDEVTYGILIGWSCREGKLKNAFIFMSEMLARGLKPHIYSYNALISGVFKEGMWKYARDILHEMNDKGVEPDMSTYKVLLAGYCRAKQFDEVKAIILEMERGQSQLTSIEDPLSKAFMILGLNSLAVKVKRDNDVGFSKTEFYDDRGNGLYLETDVVEYEKTMNRILDDSMILEFNSFVLNYGGQKNFQTAMMIIDELVHWGQELSLTDFSTLLTDFRASIIKILKKMPKLENKLDEETLNLLVNAYVKKGFTHKAKILSDRMVKRSQQIKNETYTNLITCLCKKGNLRDLQSLLELAQNRKWLPCLEDYETVIGCLCQKELLKEAFELSEKVLIAYPPHNVLETYHTLLGKLCENGFTRIACILVEELSVKSSQAYSHLLRRFCKEKCFSLIRLLCVRGYFDEAIRLKEMVSRQEPSVFLSIYGALISGYCNKGMVREASSLLQEMSLKGKPLDTEEYNALIQGYCGTKNVRKVWAFLGVIIRKKITISISSYQKLVSLMCTEGRISIAFSLKELMSKDNNLSDLIVYNILIFNLFSSGNITLVDTLLDEIGERKLEPDVVTFNFLVHGFSQCKDVSRSLYYLNAMMGKELRPSNRCLRAVIRSLCFEGELGKALKLSQEMESKGWVHCSTVQNCIVQGLLDNGLIQEAVDFLDQMSEKGLIPDNIYYDNLIKRLSFSGRHAKAVDLLDIMLRKWNVPNSTSYDYIIQGLSRCHKLEEALDFYYEMLARNLRPRISTWNALIDRFCDVGKTLEAEKLLNSMIRLGEVPSKKMFYSVVSRYQFEDNTIKASEILRLMQQHGYEPDFETHWSLISNLSKASESDKSNKGRSFLSTLLSKSGFGWRKDHEL